MSLQAGRVVYQCREKVAKLLSIRDSSRVVFTPNTTAAINMALWGVLQPGDHCVTTSMEHNAIARPLHALQKRGVDVTFVQCREDGSVDMASFAKSLRKDTRLVAMTHVSNVTGTVLPVQEIAEQAKAVGALVLVDAAQSLGVLDVDVPKLGIDLLAAPGHKSLMGPMGTGLLYVGPDADVKATVFGGTGSHSEDLDMPSQLPDRLESGTLNVVGLAGLSAGVDWVLDKGVNNLAAAELQLTQRLRNGLASIPGVKVYGYASHAPLVSFNVGELGSSEVAAILDATFNICVRPGLHCAPLAHRTIGTLRQGTVRASLGPFTTAQEVDALLSAVEEISAC